MLYKCAFLYRGGEALPHSFARVSFIFLSPLYSLSLSLIYLSSDTLAHISSPFFPVCVCVVSMTEVTNRQWRALAQALPFFIPAPAVSPHISKGEGKAPQPHAPDRRDFVENVLSRTASAFPEEVRAYQEAHGDRIASPSVLLDAAEALLTYAFGCSVLCPSQTLSSPLPMPSCSFSPLTAREVQLLRLYHRKQEQYAELFDAQQRLRGTMLTAVRSLQAAVQSVAERDGENMSLIDSTRESLQWLGASQGVAAAALQPLTTPAPQTGFTSALASLPYTGFSAPTSAAGAGHTAAPGASSDAAGPALMIVHRCVGCGEVGGDLLVCTQCGEVRHEACGGPHPPERSRVDGSLPSINVCRRCAKELNLSSSSSSLRSSTSSSERAALDEYFDSEDDSDSSLSGFVVHSSDVEEEEDEEENSEESRRGSGPEDESADKRKSRVGGEEKRYRHRRRIHSGSEGSESSEEEEEVKEEMLAHRLGKRPRKEEKKTTAALMKHQKSQSQRRKARSSSSSSSSEDEASSASPATPPAKRRLTHTAPKSKTTSLHPTPSSASSASPSAARRTQAAESPLKHRKEEKKRRKENSPPSTQDRRRMLDEEDELKMLGIRSTPEARSNGKQMKTAAAPSNSTLSSPQASQRATTPSKQQSGGRRSVVNVASSSSSSSDKDED